MHAEANLNLIRVWGGGIAERDPFYEACDEFGILVMQDFWISGEYTGPFPDNWYDVFRASAFDTIKRLQHHASLLFWTGGNEQTPPTPVDDLLRGWLDGRRGTLDGTRIYVDSSLNISGSASVDGPYGILDPVDFFQPNFPNPINPELGSVGTPTFESLRLFLPEPALSQFPWQGQVNEVWDHHDYIPYKSSGSTTDQIAIYGEKPSSTERFAYLAQLANYVQYRSLFEGFSAHMWEWYAGVFIWKSQNPWPGLRGQLYDWYLEQTGGLFGVRQACKPVHLQLDLTSNSVMLVNTSATVFEGTATAMLYDLSGRSWNGGGVTVSPKQPPVTQVLFPLLNVPTTPNTVYFADLSLANSRGQFISSHFYWLSTGDYQPLRNLAPAKVEAIGTLTQRGERWEAMVLLANILAGQPVAFWIRLQVLTSNGTKRVLPVFYEDNYISLIPGERRELRIDFAASDVPAGEAPQIWIEGWNVARSQVRLTRP